jgi:hypothetical protein
VVRGFAGLDVGDRVKVELESANVERGVIDFAARRSAVATYFDGSHRTLRR